MIEFTTHALVLHPPTAGRLSRPPSVPAAPGAPPPRGSWGGPPSPPPRPLHAPPLHASPDARRARLRRDAADGDHPREHPAALRRRRGVRALLVRRRGRIAARAAGPHD